MTELDFAVIFSGQFQGWLLKGFLLSLALTGLTLVFALPLAALVALLRMAPSRFVRAAGFVYVEGVRSVPLLVHMLWWYFGAPELLPGPAKQWLYAHDAEALCALIALVVYTTAFMAEDIRSGIRAVPVTQLEAGRALGLSFLATMRRIVLPQALRITVPPLISQTLSLWKNTSIATVIGVAELMYQAQRVETASFRGFETFAACTAAYLTISLLITALAAIYHHRYPARTA
ncbi:amino acid ABC transporter permease [Niveibacterium sp.]|uniref:amino acid ABC transporter permease n=1 Tax=Niveibacterium sp. TaxID=2017444 RepID=UPI0035B299A9